MLAFKSGTFRVRLRHFWNFELRFLIFELGFLRQENGRKWVTEPIFNKSWHDSKCKENGKLNLHYRGCFLPYIEVRSWDIWYLKFSINKLPNKEYMLVIWLQSLFNKIMEALQRNDKGPIRKLSSLCCLINHLSSSNLSYTSL